MNQEITNFIENSAERFQELIVELRKLILSTAPNVKEQYKWSRPVYALEKDFCYIQTSKKHVTLGFFEFDKIKTNKHLVEGTGKSMRHIKLSKVADIKELKIEQILKEVLAP